MVFFEMFYITFSNQVDKFHEKLNAIRRRGREEILISFQSSIIVNDNGHTRGNFTVNEDVRFPPSLEINHLLWYVHRNRK